MADLPLLFFPSPDSADRTKRKMNPGKPHKPSVSGQWERLSPVFQRLQESFNERCAELQRTPVGIDPEQALVIETIGSVENFANAVKRVRGLEWIGEVEIDEIAPDEYFYNVDKERERITTALKGRLYLVMSNQTALAEMLNLWKRYQENPNMTFDHGLTKFRDVFQYLKDIRRWGVEDRLAERKVFDIWREDIESEPRRSVRFEAELWYRGENHKRRKSTTIVSELIQNLGGRVISECVIHPLCQDTCRPN